MTPPASDAPIRVMIVDDSAVIRGLLTRYVDAEDDLYVVATAADGKMALDSLKRAEPDVAILDIEMPGMDGMMALPQLIAADPKLQVLMASTLTRQNAEISLKAMSLGAADYLAKPTSRSELHNSDHFKRELVEKCRALGRQRRGRYGGAPAAAPKPFRAEATRPAALRPSPAPQPAPAPKKPPSYTLRPAGKQRPQVLAVGSSTGGPQALFTLFGALKNDITLPVLLTQHMPATFTAILAEHLARVTGWAAREGQDGDVPAPRTIYVAPGDRHMLIDGKGGAGRLRITQDPPENFCRPAVDPMFRSVAAVYGAAALGVILTGMGSDGAKGAQALVDAGGTIIAQDEATSIVWGMPGAAANAGVCAAVLPLDAMSGWIKSFAAGRA